MSDLFLKVLKKQNLSMLTYSITLILSKSENSFQLSASKLKLQCLKDMQVVNFLYHPYHSKFHSNYGHGTYHTVKQSLFSVGTQSLHKILGIGCQGIVNDYSKLCGHSHFLFEVKNHC